tara:strand:+ start:1433 stop:2905 length:1473 start_codon:yes stop_codon:yes gene_type:complete
MPAEKPSDRVVRRFFDIDSNDSKLNFNSIVVDDNEKPISALTSLTSEMAKGQREDDGISGERRALIFKSFAFEGIHNIPDPKIAGIIMSAQGDIRKEARNLENVAVVLHYGVAEGGSLSMLDPEMVPFTMLSRFYEIFDQGSVSAANIYRTGQVARVKFKGTNFGFIESFADDAKNSSASNSTKPSAAAVGAKAAFPPPHSPGSSGAPGGGLGGLGVGAVGRGGGFGGIGGFGAGGAGSPGGLVQRMGNFPSITGGDNGELDDGVFLNSDMTYYGQTARRMKKPARFSYDLIVLHDGGYGWRSGESAVRSFVDQSRKSIGRSNIGSHYYVTKEGTVYALTPEAYSVSHAAGDNDQPWNPNSINMRSIGIDLQAAMDTRSGNRKYGGEGMYTNAQYSALGSLIGDICSRRGIPMDNQHIIHHWMVQRNRVDLRYNFDFARLGLGLSNPLGSDDPQRLVSTQVKDQYPTGDYDFQSVGGKWRPFININKTKK